MSPTETKPAFSRRERWHLAICSALLVLAVTGASVWLELAGARAKFQAQAIRMGGLVAQSIAEGTTLVSALYSFYHGNGEMSAERFPVIADKFLTAHPQVAWVAYASRVNTNDLADFEETMELEGFIDFRVKTPAGQSPQANPAGYLLPLRLLEPLDPAVARYLGRELLSDSRWNKALMQSIEHGVMNATLVSGLGDDSRGYLLTRATYRGTVEPTTPENRIKQLAGVIIIFIEEQSLLQIAGAVVPMAQLRLDATPPGAAVSLEYGAGYNVKSDAGSTRDTIGIVDQTIWMTLAAPVHVLRQSHSLTASREPEIVWTVVATTPVITLLVIAVGLFALRWRRLSQIVEQEAVAKAVIAEATLSSVGDAVVRLSEDGGILYLNPKARELSKYDESSSPPEKIADLFAFKNRQGLTLDWTSLKESIDLGERLRVRVSPDTETVVSCKLTEVFAQDSSPGFVLAIRDVSVETELASELEHQARHDPLTKLPNRRDFERRLGEMVARAVGGRAGADYTVLYLDLDQFKQVNDSCGHVAGDQLLRQLSGLFATLVTAPNVLARLGGDEFGVLLHGIDKRHALSFAQRLCDAIAQFRFVWEGRLFELGVSIGVVHITSASGTPEDVLCAADLACYAAKDMGRNRFHVHRPDSRMMARNQIDLRWQDQLREALEHEELVLHSQPIVALRDTLDTVARSELLVRLYAENGELAAPMAFIPAAERYGLMRRLDKEVIAMAMRHISTNPSDKLTYSINLSAESINDPGFENYLCKRLDEFGIDPGRICLELTESSAVSNLQAAKRLLERLRTQGIQVALDDFGAGLSSLRYLSQLPVDFVKIDGQIVKGLDQDPVSQAMVKTVVSVAELMGIKTIAEMVETDAVRVCLRDLGVDFAQGYYLGKPQLLAPALSAARTA